MTDAPDSPAPAATPSSGIFLADDFLADKSLSLEAKIIYLLIRRELDRTGEPSTDALTNPRLAAMTGFSKSTVQRVLGELEGKKFITRASQNRATTRNEKTGLAQDIRGVRHIYLDRQLANRRKQAIAKGKRPVEDEYRACVIRGGMKPDQYVAMMKLRRRQEHEDRKSREEAEDQMWRNIELAARLAETPDDQIPQMERDAGVAQGAYATIKRDHLARFEGLDLASDDDLFGK